jgi:hemerythrin-like domain-containing protein
MYSIELMVKEHEYILSFNKVVRKACASILAGGDVYPEDFYQMIDFARNYADKHHHGKEEQLLFNEMMNHLGQIGVNLIKHGMLVEHDLGRLFITELEQDVMTYEKTNNQDLKLDIIANAIGYTKLLQRHIDKEDQVVYTYAEKSLDPALLKEIDEKVKVFEEEAESKKIQEYYLGILETLSKKYSQ